MCRVKKVCVQHQVLALIRAIKAVPESVCL